MQIFLTVCSIAQAFWMIMHIYIWYCLMSRNVCNRYTLCMSWLVMWVVPYPLDLWQPGDDASQCWCQPREEPYEGCILYILEVSYCPCITARCVQNLSWVVSLLASAAFWMVNQFVLDTLLTIHLMAYLVNEPNSNYNEVDIWGIMTEAFLLRTSNTAACSCTVPSATT